MTALLGTAWNVVLILVGFGLVIAVHELGHFLAAKWAGVRVHAFAIGFGRAIGSWRKGLGLRWGSSEPEYFRRAARDSHPEPGTLNPEPLPSPTEYRLNWFPFGGYVKMLGQEDLSPIGAAGAPDSFASKPVWKRAVIMSGGVFMNLLLAGALFIASYMHGISEIAPVIGDVAPGSPAEVAGLMPGDRIASIDGERVDTFNDLRLATAMADPRTPLKIAVEREGDASPVTLEVTPTKGADGLLQIGVGPGFAARLYAESDLPDPDTRAAYVRQLQEAGLNDIQPGMMLTKIAGEPLPPDAGPESTDPRAASGAQRLRAALAESKGELVRATFADAAGREVEVSLAAEPRYQVGTIKQGEEEFASRHLLGLAPVMRVAATQERGRKAGLLPGDVFARIGSLEWPSVAAGIAEVRAHRGRTIDLIVLRDGALVNISAPVNSGGLIGFAPSDTADDSTLIGAAPGLRPRKSPAATAASSGESFPAARVIPAILSGSRITAVNGTAVSNFRELRSAIQAAAPADSVTLRLSVELPLKDDAGLPRTDRFDLPLTRADLESVRALGWDPGSVLYLFRVAEFTDRATGPLNAIAKGVKKTHHVVMMTYVTFLRLFQGTVPVSQLHGPVGITHLGSQVAERGFIYVLFFLGLISANLAVINFLPLPIFDGGHVVFLAIEAITRKPVSAGVQSAAIMVGLMLIGTIFLVVTFNDIVRLFG